MDAAFVFFNLGALHDLGQQAVFGLTDTPGHAAVVGHGIAQQITHHAVVINRAVFHLAQRIIKHLISGFSVVVVSVDYRKGCVIDGILGTQHRMASTPGLRAFSGDRVAGGEIVQLLIGIADLHGAFFQPLTHGGHEVLTDGFLDNDDSGFKACLVSIEQRKVQNCFSLASNGVNLFQTAVAAAHAGGQNDQNGFLSHKTFSS